MAWIESHQELARHPKVLRLARLLKINKAQAIGHLHLLWWWTLDYSPTGELSAFTSCELGSAAEWQGDGDQFRKALGECGLVDEDGAIHDWHEYAGKLVARREADRARKKADNPAFQRNSSGIPPDVLRNSGAQNPTVPDRTEQNPTQPKRGRAEDGGSEQKPPGIELSIPQIPDAIRSSPECLELWGKWLQHLKQKRKSPSVHAQDMQLRKLELMGTPRAIAALKHSIEGNWQGIYEPSPNNRGNGSGSNGRNSGLAGPSDPTGQAERRAEAQRKRAAARSANQVASEVAGHGSNTP